MRATTIIKSKSYAKFGNRRSKCFAGHYHQSCLEADHCNSLWADVKAGRIKEFECQKKYPLNVNEQHICNHYVDFEITKTDGSIEIHETKGMATDVWIMKHRLFMALYPHIPYVIVK